MLRRTMITSLGIQLGLEDLLADLRYARKNGELGRLALLAYCDVRGWARQAGQPEIADSATRMFTENPCVSKNEFLVKVDTLIAVLEKQQRTFPTLIQPFAPRFSVSELAQAA
jgi:hypothetical protein